MSLEDNLHTQARTALESEAEPPHLDDERLAQAAEGTRPLQRAERAHLSRCAECRDVLAAAAVAAPPAPAQVITPRRWLRVAVPLIAAAAGALFMVSKASPPSVSSEYQVRGKPGGSAEAASVTFLATDPDGRRRDLVAGDTVRRGERLGFRYGNPSGAAQTLTLIGWDGQTVHWYYPTEEGGPPAKLQQGPKAQSLRLPLDDTIGPGYKAGRLSLIAAFDADPKALADRVRRGEAVAGLRLRVLP
jgi:hypothetical protein